MTVAAISGLILPGGVVTELAATDKDAAMAALAVLAATETGLPASLILERVREREGLGPTGFGQGAAIPHARIAGLMAVVVIAARLATPIDYDALDGQPVDIVVLLLSPEGAGADHLKALARISRVLRDPAVLARLRSAPDAESMRAALNGDPVRQAA